MLLFRTFPTPIVNPGPDNNEDADGINDSNLSYLTRCLYRSVDMEVEHSTVEAAGQPEAQAQTHAPQQSSPLHPESNKAAPKEELPKSSIKEQQQRQSELNPEQQQTMQPEPSWQQRSQTAQQQPDEPAPSLNNYNRETASNLREKSLDEVFNLGMDIVLEFDRIDEGDLSTLDHVVQFSHFKGLVISDSYLRRLRSAITELWSNSNGRRIPLGENTNTIEALQKALLRSLQYTNMIFTMKPIDLLESTLTSAKGAKPLTEIMGIFEAIVNSISSVKVVLLGIQYFGSSHEEMVTIQSDEIISEVGTYMKGLIHELILPLITLSSQSTSSTQFTKHLRELVDSVVSGCVSALRYLRRYIESPGSNNEDLFTQLDTMSTNILLTKVPESGAILPSDSFDPLYFEAMNILVFISRSYSEIKSTLLELSTQLYLLDSGKKSFPRRYRIPQLRTGISVMSALVMKVVQNCYILPEDMAHAEDDDAVTLYLEKCNSAYEKANTGCSGFISSLLLKIREQNSTVQKNFFDVFIKDTLDVMGLPEWPAAELLIQNLVSWLKHIINDKKPKIDVNVRLQTVAIDTMGKIESSLLELIAKSSGEPHAHIELARISPEEIRDCCATGKAILGKMKSDWGRRPEYHSSYGYIFFQLYLSLAKITKNVKTSLEARNEAEKAMREIIGFDDHSRMNETDFTLAYSKYLEYRPFKGYSDIVIKCLSNELTESKRMVKAKVISVLSDLIDNDSKIFLNNHVRAALEKNLSDSSVTVREKAVQIVGKYSAYPEFSNDSYYILLCGHTSDPATAVRKRAISVLRTIYMAGRGSLETRQKIINSMLDRIDDDEESIQKVVKDNLKEIFFSGWNYTADQTDPNNYAATKSSVLRVIEVIPSSLANPNEAQKRLKDQFHKFLSEVLNAVDPDVQNNLQCAETIVGVLTELSVNEDESKKQDKMLESIAIFVTARNNLIKLKHLHALKHLLIQEVKDNRYSRYYTLVIFRDGLNGVAELPEKDLLKYLIDNLPRMISRVSHREIRECVPCFWLACKLMSNHEPCVKLLDKCLIQFDQRIQAIRKTGLDEKSVNVCKRLLNIIGVSARYFQLTEEEVKQMAFNKKQRKTATSLGIEVMMPIAKGIYPSSEQLLLETAELNQALRKCALESIGDACIGNPASFRSINSLYTDILQNKDDYDAASIVMSTMFEFSEAQEENADHMARESLVAKKSKKKLEEPVDITNGSYNSIEASTSLEFAKLYGAYIRNIALTSIEEPGLWATKFIEISIRQGAAFPQDVTPTIIALEASEQEEIASLAKRGLRQLFSKYEQAMSPHYITGLKLAAKYCRQMYPEKFYELSNKLDSFYSCFATKTVKKKLLSSVLRSFNFDLNSTSNDKLTDHVYYVAFMARNLSCVEFAETEEANVLVNGIKELLNSSGMLVDERSSELLSHNVEEVQKWREAALLSLIFHILYQFMIILKKTYLSSSKPPATPSGSILNLNQFYLDPNTFDNVEVNKDRCKAFSNAIGVYAKDEERKRKAEEGDHDGNEENNVNELEGSFSSISSPRTKQPRIE